jgi:hypothetical protein
MSVKAMFRQSSQARAGLLSPNAKMCEPMHMRSTSITACVGCVVFIITAHLAFAESRTRCTLPTGLGNELSRNHPGTHLVTLTDLRDEERNVFLSEHGSDCPGLVSVDFYGDGEPTFALVLLEEKSKTAELFVAHKAKTGWNVRLLENADARPVPVVWQDRAGKYDDVYGEKSVRAKHPVILLCGYGSWAILYAWNGKRVEKIWLAD